MLQTTLSPEEGIVRSIEHETLKPHVGQKISALQGVGIDDPCGHFQFHSSLILWDLLPCEMNREAFLSRRAPFLM